MIKKSIDMRIEQAYRWGTHSTFCGVADAYALTRSLWQWEGGTP